MKGKGTTIYKRGSTRAGPQGEGHLNEMEAFIVIKGHVQLRSPVKLDSVSIKQVAKRYDQIEWSKIEDPLHLKFCLEEYETFQKEFTVTNVWLNDCTTLK